MNRAHSPLPQVLLEGVPALRAVLRGNGAYPGLLGEVLLYPWQEGTLLVTRAAGLPRDGFFALHIHTLGCCRTGGDIPFYCAGGHFDPQQQPHPDHAGDLPVLLSHRGRAFSVTFTGASGQRRCWAGPLSSMKARTITAPAAGDAGGRIACGVIEAF